MEKVWIGKSADTGHCYGAQRRKNATKTNEGKRKGKETFDEAKGDKHIGQPELHGLLHWGGPLV